MEAGPTRGDGTSDSDANQRPGRGILAIMRGTSTHLLNFVPARRSTDRLVCAMLQTARTSIPDSDWARVRRP
jgi:hypothetical protein